MFIVRDSYFCEVKKWRHLLWPFGLLYAGIVKVRNFCFDIGILKQHSFDVPTIVVGNLSTGGTGKSPHTEWLILTLKDQFKIATLSRGYGRKTKGYLAVSLDHSAQEVGDEPLQFKNKFPDQFISVCEKRVEGIHQISASQPDTELVLLDDAYQHRHVKPGFSILLTTYHEPFFNDFILPVGNLRESTSGKERANAILVTKCPEELGETERQQFVNKINAKDTPVYFTSFAYKSAKALFDSNLEAGLFSNVLVVTGIAKPEVFIEALNKSGKTVLSHLRFADHHDFSQNDIDEITSTWKNCIGKTAIFTTEKDAMRLKAFPSAFDQIPIFFVPIEVVFIDKRQNELENSIVSYVRANKKNC